MISVIQRAVIGVGCGVQAVLDPYRYDCVAYSTEATTSAAQLDKIRQKVSKTEEGRLLLEQKPSINTNTVDLEALKDSFSTINLISIINQKRLLRIFLNIAFCLKILNNPILLFEETLKEFTGRFTRKRIRYYARSM